MIFVEKCIKFSHNFDIIYQLFAVRWALSTLAARLNSRESRLKCLRWTLVAQPTTRNASAEMAIPNNARKKECSTCFIALEHPVSKKNILPHFISVIAPCVMYLSDSER